MSQSKSLVETSQTVTSVQIEISLDKLESLLQNGHLCAAQIRCLNAESKQHIQNLCLNTCTYTLCQKRFTARPLQHSDWFTDIKRN